MDQSRATTRPPVAARPIVARAWERVRIGVLWTVGLAICGAFWIGVAIVVEELLEGIG